MLQFCSWLTSIRFQMNLQSTCVLSSIIITSQHQMPGEHFAMLMTTVADYNQFHARSVCLCECWSRCGFQWVEFVVVSILEWLQSALADFVNGHQLWSAVVHVHRQAPSVQIWSPGPWPVWKQFSTPCKVKVRWTWICIVPHHRHTSKALRYGTRSQGISQFYLHPHIPSNGMNHTCL